MGGPEAAAPLWGVSWEATGVLLADTSDVLCADTTDDLSADTTDALSADTFSADVVSPSPKCCLVITCNIWLRLEYRPMDSA